MPIFNYKCRQCQTECELLQARFDSAVECPNCQSADLEKLPSRFAAVLHSAPRSCAGREVCPSAHNCSGNCHCGEKR
ncbi:MAG: hypothetical protein LBM70_06840 [Victivallales bacterium]|nr:hypothetical protein [Victivallales bacterium]